MLRCTLLITAPAGMPETVIEVLTGLPSQITHLEYVKLMLPLENETVPVVGAVTEAYNGCTIPSANIC